MEKNFKFEMEVEESCFDYIPKRELDKDLTIDIIKNKTKYYATVEGVVEFYGTCDVLKLDVFGSSTESEVAAKAECKERLSKIIKQLKDAVNELEEIYNNDLMIPVTDLLNLYTNK